MPKAASKKAVAAAAVSESDSSDDEAPVAAAAVAPKRRRKQRYGVPPKVVERIVRHQLGTRRLLARPTISRRTIYEETDASFRKLLLASRQPAPPSTANVSRYGHGFSLNRRGMEAVQLAVQSELIALLRRAMNCASDNDRTRLGPIDILQALLADPSMVFVAEEVHAAKLIYTLRAAQRFGTYPVDNKETETMLDDVHELSASAADADLRAAASVTDQKQTA